MLPTYEKIHRTVRNIKTEVKFMKQISKQKKIRILSVDPSLKPYEAGIRRRIEHYEKTREVLLGGAGDIVSFANGHLYYGVHRVEGGWVVREHAPAADAVCLTGDFNNWDKKSHPMKKTGMGDWEIYLEGHDALKAE